MRVRGDETIVVGAVTDTTTVAVVSAPPDVAPGMSPLAASDAVPDLVQRLLIRLRSAAADLPGRTAEEILEASELLAVTALHAHTAENESRTMLERASRPFEVDALTGLPNRALFRDRFSQALAHARRRNARVALLFVDLDRFKEINDAHGHTVGDMIIQHVARSLKDAGRDVDTVCRHGGDEFLVLLSEIGDAASAGRYAEKVTASLSEHVRVGDETFTVSASIGISLYPDDGEDQEQLIQKADAAMYVAKRTGNAYAYVTSRHDRPATPLRSVAVQGQDPVGLLEAALSEANIAIADLKAANARLQLDFRNAEREQVKAHQATLHQSQLLNVVAHELRNSLSPLQSAADVLALVQSDASLMPRLELILKRQITHITALLTDLLDVSRLNMGRLKLDLTDVDLSIVVDEAAARTAIDFARRNHTLRIVRDAKVTRIEGDQPRLVQIVAALLDRVSDGMSQGGTLTAALYTRSDRLIVSVAEAMSGAEEHDDDAMILDAADDSRDAARVPDNSVLSLLVVIELLKSHGGQLTLSRLPPHHRRRFQMALPLDRPQ